MSRLSATLRLDAQLQARNKVYLIIAIAALGLAFALRALFTPDQLHFFMPLVALSGVTLTTFSWSPCCCCWSGGRARSTS